ncbi:helix-turn-helix domain-containing protein [Anaerotruncus colihominis]|uniref:helix-turn-helix domain-containing protein n=1 Tax=Anaerotruncus colihominis TaxID=169435 RepID=UPI00242F6F40|nr:helix-turn-helix domain-containing protein [Anaerotruncus colihominis]
MTICERMFSMIDDSQGTLKQADLCRILEIKSSTMSTWKKTGKDPDAKYIARISNFLGCSVEYLLTGQDTEKAPVPELSVNERDMLKYFKQLTEREQAILIGEARVIVMFDEIASVPPGSASSDGKAG